MKKIYYLMGIFFIVTTGVFGGAVFVCSSDNETVSNAIVEVINSEEQTVTSTSKEDKTADDETSNKDINLPKTGENIVISIMLVCIGVILIKYGFDVIFKRNNFFN